MLLKVLFGLFLMVHGLIHAAYFGGPADPKYPFVVDRSWLITKMGLTIGTLKPIVIIMATIALVGFVMAGLSYLSWLVPHQWLSALVVTSAIVSALLMIATWNNNFVVGIGIDLVLIILVMVGKLK